MEFSIECLIGGFEQLEWLFFDLGSTLIDEGAALERYIGVCVEKLARQGVAVTPSDYEAVLLLIAKQGGDSIRDAWLQFSSNPLERPRWSHEREKLYPKVKSVLASLKKQYHLGVIANQGKHLQLRLADFGILNEFEVVVGSADVGLAKPEPAIFHYALEEAGIVPTQAAYIGDRVDNDIVPAKKLGMTAIRLRQGLGKYSPEDEAFPSDRQLNSIEELLGLSFPL